MYMFSFISKFCRTNKNTPVFSKEYRDGYNKLWINSIRDYQP